MDQVSQINSILKNFNLQAQCLNYQEVDSYYFYDLSLSSKTRIKNIEKFSNEIALAIKANNKPRIKILHQQGLVRLEFAKDKNNNINLLDYFTNQNIPAGELICLLGQGVSGQRVWMDLSKNPHLIIAGTTGSGKSTLLHNIIANLLNYSSAKLFLVDPKNIEFNDYGTKFSRIQVGHSYEESIKMIDNVILIMEERYSLIRQGADINKIPYLVLMVDEFADLILQDGGNQCYERLCKLSQKCRAAKICIIIATQRPSADIVSGVIKANFPARIACRVASHVDSKVILDAVGAENLAGYGDALLRDNFRFLERLQIAYITSQQVCRYFGEFNE